jgi:hypothetical protein
MKLLIMQFFPTSCHFTPLWSKLRSEEEIPNINIKYNVLKKYYFYFEYCMTSKNDRKFQSKCVCAPLERILVAPMPKHCACVKKDSMLFSNPITEKGGLALPV